MTYDDGRPYCAYCDELGCEGDCSAALLDDESPLARELAELDDPMTYDEEH